MVYFGLGILYLIFGVVNFESLMYLCYLGSLCICGVRGNLRLGAIQSEAGQLMAVKQVSSSEIQNM